MCPQPTVVPRLITPATSGLTVDIEVDVFTSGPDGYYQDFTDLANLSQNSDGTGAVTTAGDPIGKVADLSPFDRPGLQATSGLRPILEVSGSINCAKFDGSDDGMTTTTTFGANMDCFVGLKRNTPDTQNVLFNYENTAYFGVFESGSSSAASAGVGSSLSYKVNGSDIGSTRDALATACPEGTWVLFEVNNLDLSGWAYASLLRYTFDPAYVGNSSVAFVYMCPAMIDKVRAQIRTALGAKIGLSL